MNEHAPDKPSPATEAEGKKSNFRRPLVFVIGAIVFAAALFWVGVWLLRSFTHESTDDAFLDAHIVTVAPKIAGLVSAVHVKQNQLVQPGDPLVDIDARDFETKLAQKRAAAAASSANHKTILASYELIRTRIDTAQATAKQTQAEAAASEATASKAAADLARNQELRNRNVISTQEFETFKTTATAAQANLRAAREKAASDASKVKEAQAQFEAAKPVIEMAQAQMNSANADVRAAELDLSYAKISAPIAGRVTNKKVEPGDYIQIGQALFALVPSEFWVTANFKETQLKKIRLNQTAEISIDSVADKTFRGHVESIQSGSGARFSLLPPENAVGNFVKVVQRVPVKIVFDEPLDAEHVLGPGESATPSVRVSDFNIPKFVLALAAAVVAALGAVGVWVLTKPKNTT